MSKRIMQNVKKYFETYLTVNSPDTMVEAASTTCASGTITVDPINDPIDLYIVVKCEINSSETNFAAASVCKQSSFDFRPIIGVYYLNFSPMEVSPTIEYLYFGTLAHEFTHILGFSYSLFSYYVDGSNVQRPVSEIVQSKFISLLKKAPITLLN